jgi:hypothetical protein
MSDANRQVGNAVGSALINRDWSALQYHSVYLVAM